MTAADQKATEGAAGTRAPAETVELPSIEELSRRASERAWSIRSMNVESAQTISFLRITTSDLQQVGLTEFPTDGREAIRLFKEKVQSAEVVIKAAMDRRRFDVRMWNRGDDRMITRYVIERTEDAAAIREEQWYPILDDYRTVGYIVDPGNNPRSWKVDSRVAFLTRSRTAVAPLAISKGTGCLRTAAEAGF